MSEPSTSKDGTAGGTEPTLNQEKSADNNSGEKGAIGDTTTEATSSLFQGVTNSPMNELVTAMTAAFRQSSAQPGSSDPMTSRNLVLRQPKPYSLGQNFKVWLSQLTDYLTLANIPESKRKAFLVTILEQSAYRAVQLLKIPDTVSYQDFVDRLTIRFDSGKSAGDYKMLLRARQQNLNENIDTFADNLLELAENAYPEASYRFKEEMAKDRFLEGVRCGDACREQLFIRQPESLSAAVRLVRQLESARVASRSSTGSKPQRSQLNVVEENENVSDVAELKTLMLSINSRLVHLEKQRQEPRQRSSRNLAKVKCYCCQKFGHYARDCPNKSGNEMGGLPRVDQPPQ